ncbi:hypothetical protein ADEAN_000234400 [Angomonas deanei]|uniref:CCHC-type domain-containing protein n=1 Tax=Angomonas deanei TaxID=59799 RepID=A0A7G2C776_9TRYP|nr:hypothetical protein ADEAN_000234400 [Angomonas deanei]
MSKRSRYDRDYSDRGDYRGDGHRSRRDDDYDRDRSSRRHRDDGDRGRDRYDDRDRDRNRRGRRSRRDRRRRGHGGSVRPPPVTRNVICHICERNHWTVECRKLYDNPDQYPYLDRKRGCFKCGKRGHDLVDCREERYRCKECGGVHKTKDCYFDHVPEEWHEFFDVHTRHVYYVNSANNKEVSWEPPAHELDEIYWYCSVCQLMIPNKYNECLKCHKARPVTAADISSSDSSDDDSSNGDGDSNYSD